jgi:hypothetical protein
VMGLTVVPRPARSGGSYDVVGGGRTCRVEYVLDLWFFRRIITCQCLPKDTMVLIGADQAFPCDHIRAVEDYRRAAGEEVG